MVQANYTPTYYSSLHDSITSLCKTILPFSFKKRRLPPSSEKKLSDLQTNNLKWQQDSFHQIFNLMGLHKEGILAETEVATFRIYLLDTLIASPPDQQHPLILKDKLLFLQELLYAKCISEEEYHSSKRPLLQRLAVQGAVINTRDVVVAGIKDYPKENSVEEEEEWSVIDLKEENPLLQDIGSSSSGNSKRRPFKKLLMKWKKNDSESEVVVCSPIQKKNKRKILKEASPSDFFIDRVNKQTDVNSIKEHVGETERKRNIARDEKKKPWIVFEEDENENENFHPNLFAPNPFGVQVERRG